MDLVEGMCLRIYRFTCLVFVDRAHPFNLTVDAAFLRFAAYITRNIWKKKTLFHGSRSSIIRTKYFRYGTPVIEFLQKGISSCETMQQTDILTILTDLWAFCRRVNEAFNRKATSKPKDMVASKGLCQHEIILQKNLHYVRCVL